MKLSLETNLSAPPERVWAEVKTIRLFRHVTAPFIVFRSAEPGGFPDHFVEGAHRVSMYFLGFIPIGQQVVNVSKGSDVGPDYWLRDNGHSALIKKWDHRITVAPTGAGHTLYRDEVDIDAGLMTPFVFVFASAFFRWRQHRWRRLVDRHFEYR